MRVPILLVLPAQEPLIESALESRNLPPYRGEGQPRIPFSAVQMPPGVQHDTTFAAVPIGTGRPDDLDSIALASNDPVNSQKFAVLGNVEVSSLADIPPN